MGVRVLLLHAQELELLDEDSAVYKLTGPILVKQVRGELWA